MASAQYERKEEEAVGLSYETKATLDELIKQAESVDIEEQSIAALGAGGHEQSFAVGAGGHQQSFAALGAGGHQQSFAVGAHHHAGAQHNHKAAIAVGANIRTTLVAGALKNQAKGPLTRLATKKWAGHIVKDFPKTLDSAGAFTFSALTSKGVKAAVVYSGKNKAGVDTAWLLAFADTKDLKRRVYAEGGPKSNFININWDKVEQNLNKARESATAPGVSAKIVGTSGKSAVAAIFSG